MTYMFDDATLFSQQLCWDVIGKTVTYMFTNTNGAAIIVCAPSSAPTSPTGQPTTLPTIRTKTYRHYFQDKTNNIGGLFGNGLKGFNLCL